MSNGILKDTFREIKKSFGRFLSIFAIIAIGVAFFAGVKEGKPVMKASADKYFDEYNLMDMKVIDPLGLNNEDIEKIKGISDIEGVFPSKSVDVIADIDSEQLVLKFQSMPMNSSEENLNYINRVNLVEGRLPNKGGECVIGEGALTGTSLKVGDKIKISSGTKGDVLDTLQYDEYEVVGIGNNPNYLSHEMGTSNIGHGKVSTFAYALEEDFKAQSYTEALVTVKGAKELNSYGDEYFVLTDKIKASLEELNAGGVPSKIVLDRNSHYSYRDYGQSADKIGDISNVFPVFFFLVAALVCLTTMTRMVDEQRSTIGTLKALGYSKGTIAFKYVFYAAVASIAGSIVGLAVGLTLFPTVIFNAWGIMYTVPEIKLIFDIPLSIITTLVAVIITTSAAMLACYKELIETPSLLMRPKAPKDGKRIILERITFLWKRMNFTEKVTARNILRYKKRFFMTIIGIAGCTALLLAGFGMKDSLSTIASTQFDEILQYDGQMVIDEELTLAEKDTLTAEYRNDERIKDLAEVSSFSKEVISGDKSATVNLMVPKDMNIFKDYFHLRERVGKEEIDLKDNGIVITEKLSKVLKVKKGDMLNIDGKEVEITDITEMYVDHYIFMSPKLYEDTFGVSSPVNSLLLKVNDNTKSGEDILAGDIMEDENVKAVFFYSGIVEGFDNTIASLNVVVLVLIISAGILAFVVLYNLTNVNISERLREIATIKVLGFYDKEVSAYVYRENLVLTAIGSLVGVGLGTILHRFIMSTVEFENIMFGRNIDFISYILAIGITMLFSILVNLVMYKKLKKVPMVESLKSVE